MSTRQSSFLNELGEASVIKRDLTTAFEQARHGGNMKMTTEDKRLLDELCQQHGVNVDKLVKLLDAVRDYEFKDRRTDVYDALREILKSKPASLAEGMSPEEFLQDFPTLSRDAVRAVIAFASASASYILFI